MALCPPRGTSIFIILRNSTRRSIPTIRSSRRQCSTRLLIESTAIRCLIAAFYSQNIGNLFMAGRNVSVTHEALGTVRVMKTGGMIGEVVGKAASICVKNECSPRDVYERYFGELKELLQLPGAARRKR